MDLFQRTCINEGIIFGDVNAIEEEIFEDESQEYMEEQYPEESLTEQIDIDAVYKELECMKRRIQKFQLMLKKKDIDECPQEEGCIDYELLLNCSENREICSLQKDQYKVQRQINEILECCKYAKDQIADLRSMLCRQHEQILELQKMINLLNSWRMTLDHDFGLCLERFEYIKAVKLEWSDIADKMEKQRQCFIKTQEKYVPKACFVRDKEDFINTINDMKENIFQLFEYMQKRFEFAELSNIARNLNVETPTTPKTVQASATDPKKRLPSATNK